MGIESADVSECHQGSGCWREPGIFGGNSVLCVVPMEPSSSGVPNRCIRRELVFAYARKHVGGG